MGYTFRHTMAKATLHMLHTCPFCWKVRGIIEYLKLDVDYVSVNGLKIKKSVSFAGDWGKVPVFTDENGQHHTDSTPIMKIEGTAILISYNQKRKNQRDLVQSPQRTLHCHVHQ